MRSRRSAERATSVAQVQPAADDGGVRPFVSTCKGISVNANDRAGDRPVIVTTIGTCRIADPILAATRSRHLKRANQRVYGFAHTIREVRQQIDDLLGLRALPIELEPFLTDRVGGSKGDVDKPADAYFVEVSTRKELRFRDWTLQVNYVERSFRHVPEILRIFRSRSNNEERIQRQELLAAHPDFETLDDQHRAVLRETYVHHTTFEELDAGLMTVVERLPAPVIFFCHVDVDDVSGRQLTSRRDLCSWMRMICKDRGYQLVDPTEQVLAYGRHAALAKHGSDVNHYSSEFKAHYGSWLVDAVLSPAQRPDVTPSTQDNRRSDVGAGKQVLIAAEKSSWDRPWGFIRREGPAPGTSEAVQQTVDLARKYVSKGSLEMADLALAQAPAAEAVSTLQGEIATRRGDDAAAERFFRDALRIDPLALTPKLGLLRLLLASERLDEADGFAVELIDEAPRSVRGLLLAAKVFSKLRRFEDAASTCSLAAGVETESPQPLVDTARYWMKAKQYENALAAAEGALARDASHGGAHVQRIEALCRMRDANALFVALRAGARFAPDVVIQRLRNVSGRFDAIEIASILVAARVAKPDGELPADMVAATISKLTATAEASADDATAIPVWQLIRGLDTGNKKARRAIRNAVTPYVAEARRHMAEEQPAAAMSAYRSALDIDPLDRRLQREFASFLEKTGMWADAAERWKVLGLAPDGVEEALVRGARAARKAEQPLLALSFYDRLSSDSRVEHVASIESAIKRATALMRQYLAAEQFEDAAIAARAILKIDPGHETSHRILEKTAALSARKMRDAAVSVKNT